MFLSTILITIFCSLVHSNHNVYNLWSQENVESKNIQEQEVIGLITRLIGNKAKEFHVTVDPKFRNDGGKMKARIVKDEDSDVQIIGSSGVAVAWIFHHYLKYYCNSHVSWETKQISIPNNLPSINVTLSAVDLFRYKINIRKLYC